MSKSQKSRKNGQAPVAEPAVNAEQNPNAEVVVEPQPEGGEAPLNAAEEMKFSELERHIELNLGGFMLVGKALKAINADRLYRAKFKKFEDYCRERWGLSDKYAYRLINAYTCVDTLQRELSPNGETQFPTNESQVRPLLSLDTSKWVRAWQKVLKACKDKPITADEVEKVVDKMLGQPGEVRKTTGPKTKSNPAEQKLVKIEKLVTEALEDDSEPTVATLKQVLEKIQKLLGSKK